MGRARGLWPIALVAWGIFCFAALLGPAAFAQPSGGRPWLGVVLDAVPAGGHVPVGHVVRGSPAERAGIQAGDALVSVDGTPVSRADQVIQTVMSHAVGDAVDVALVRSGRARTARVVLTQLPAPDQILRMDLVGAPAPSWPQVQPVSGDFPSSIAALRGRVVLLDFWATWCAPCRAVAVELGALQARYGAQGLRVLGVSTEPAEQVALFAQRAAMRYAVASDSQARTTRSYGVVSLPTLVVIDKRGVVRDVTVGYDPGGEERLESDVRALLSEPAPPEGADATGAR